MLGAALNRLERDDEGSTYASSASNFSGNDGVRLDSAGVLTGSYAHADLRFPTGIDADANVNVYISNASTTGVGVQLFKFSSTGTFLEMFVMPEVTSPLDMAIDEFNGILYVVNVTGGIPSYDILQSVTTFISTVATPRITSPTGIYF